jgi:predicted RND superfamily exporter protein
VSEVSSISSVVRRMNETISGEGEAGNRIPDSKEAVAQLFLMYSMSGDPSDFDRMVDFPYEHALLSARIGSISTGELTRVSKAAKTFIAEQPDSPFTAISGFARLLTELIAAMVYGQIWSLLLSLVVVTLIVALLFRSMVAGLLAIVPLAAAMSLLFGLMGYIGIELNHITALLASIMIGVGVDYTIHFLWRYREERRMGLAPDSAVFTAMTTTGRGIVFNALSVIVGFAVLFISGFVPIKWFGFLVTVSIGTCLLGALVVLPALALVARPQFLEPDVPAAEEGASS